MCTEESGTAPEAEAGADAGSAGGGNHDTDCGCHDCERDHELLEDFLTGIQPDCCGCGAELVVLRGYMVKERGTKDHWRLYLALAMNEYLLLKDRDIVAQRQIGPGSLVWVCSDAAVRHVRSRSGRQIVGDIFEGPIARARSGDGEDGDGGGFPVPDPYTSFGCPASLKPSRCC